MPHAPDHEISLAALTGPVTIYRDDYAIPHIRAATVTDAFVAQGYVHAQDRMWLMDCARRQMQGRWSEWVGPAGLESDKMARRLGAVDASKRDYDALGDEGRSVIDAYAAGVNAYLAQGDARRSSTSCSMKTWRLGRAGTVSRRCVSAVS